LAVLNLQLPLTEKRLLVIVETDGCFTDGVEVVTQATVGHRTLRVEDYGKIAATFVDIHSGEAYRISPRPNVRQKAWEHAPEENERYQAQLQAYQVMPENELFHITQVELTTPLERIISVAGKRTTCDACGEEIFNEREIVRYGQCLCRACAGNAYFCVIEENKSKTLSHRSSSAYTQSNPTSKNPLP
jgi:formylmethanofuran dehydrogenase subunit E